MQTFEEGITKVGQSDTSKRFITYDGLLRTLHHDGGKLLVVTNHNEATHGMRMCQKSHYLRFEHLRCLVKNQ